MECQEKRTLIESYMYGLLVIMHTCSHLLSMLMLSHCENCPSAKTNTVEWILTLHCVCMVDYGDWLGLLTGGMDCIAELHTV